MAKLYRNTGRFEQMLEVAQQSFSISGDNVEAHVVFGEALTEAGKADPLHAENQHFGVEHLKTALKLGLQQNLPNNRLAEIEREMRLASKLLFLKKLSIEETLKQELVQDVSKKMKTLEKL